ncbi:MAG: calcium-translocating P-type ATPase, PMCA-type [Oscillospiraceae bacterium]|jgi:Ca2+-transporting ATPase|nr:calcium-translocating P-type ATPase, PMCA-type [Oscillospiraceae bacterium]
MNLQDLSITELLKELDVDQNSGLDFKQIRSRHKKFGKNILKEGSKPSFYKKVLEQFSDFTVMTLFVAAGISFITSFINKNNDYIDSIIILAIVIINTIIGVAQESQAEKAIDSLKKLSISKAKVLRNGQEQKIISEEMVPGDILFIESGDKICADARIIKSRNLRVEESILTGESNSVSKNENDSKKNMVFTASYATSGRAIAVVIKTGMDTQIGKIAGMINRAQPPSTPLQKRLIETSKNLSITTIIICLIIFILGLFQHIYPLDMFMIAISLAVAAIPEGLPVIVTIALSTGVRKMVKKNVIIRRLPAVETLGSATVICVDKTGTLTQNKITVTEIQDINGKLNFESQESIKILSFAALCNNSKQAKNNISGEPTENALVAASSKFGETKSELEKKFPRIKEIPFDPTRKTMTTIHKNKENYRIITKGAPDVLLKLCKYYMDKNNCKPLDDFARNKIKKNYETMAKHALRVLAVAYKNETCESKNLEENMILLGLIGMIDPPRPEAKNAVKECIEANIKPIMITGDHVLTAKAIAQELGIMTNNSTSITGKELNEIDQKTLEKNIHSYSVFARVSPEHKVKIIKAFQARGEVVAMTGDGVNDAPALKIADIGCAMGFSGTDVAKSASDMILTDDNFASIVEAAKQGRGIYDNIKKTIHFLIATNIGEVVTVFLAFVLKLPTPLLAIQLLWINFVTDSFPALALSVEPIEEDVMKRKPIDTKKSMFSGSFGYNMIIEGCFIGVVGLLAFILGLRLFDSNPLDPISGRTMAFVTLGLSQFAHAFNVRSEKSIFKTGISGNPKLIWATILCVFLQIIVTILPQFNDLFKTECMNILQWLIVLPLACLPIFITELEKFIANFGKDYCFGFKCETSNMKRN